MIAWCRCLVRARTVTAARGEWSCLGIGLDGGLEQRWTWRRAWWWNGQRPLARGGWGVIAGRGVLMAADAVAGETGPAEFGILGPLEVCRSGCVLPLGGPRQRAVLALLLLEANRVVSMDRLAEDIWGGHPPEGWATTLQTYVFHLRRALEPGRARGVAGDVLVTRDRGYLLRADREHLDAARFQDRFTAGRAALDAGRYAEAAGTLRQALGLWRSGVLADLADYAFTRPEAARLEELRLAALEARIDADLALGRHDTLTGELERLAAEHPLRERLHGQLMLALYRCGRQAEALAAYRRARDLLAGELGIDPGEPLRRLHASVLAHDPALDWSDSRQGPAEDHRADAGPPAASPTLEQRGPRPTPGSRVLGWGQWRGRRLLVAGLALAVAAAAAIVAVARPWAGGPAGLPANTVGLIDTAGARVGAAVSVGSPAGLAYGDGSVWAVDSTEGTLSRINPATHAVIQQIPVGSAPTAVAITRDGNVWVANSGDGTVSRINAAADRVVDTIPVGNLPVAIASGPSGVWVANEGDDTVDQIDPATGTVTRSGPGRRAAQTASRSGRTPSGSPMVRTAPLPGSTRPPASRAAQCRSVPGLRASRSPRQPCGSPTRWISPSPRSTRRPTGSPAPSASRDGPSTIVAASNALWVSDEFDATLDRIDPRTGKVTRSVFVGSSPRGLAATPSGMWVAARPFAAASHRGGTLTVVSDYLPERDPVQAYDPFAIPALATVYDGLVTLRRSGGADGLTLVPDLAWTLPRPAGGGTTYTFTLRPGIRYSNGTLVRASDFRRGIQRQLSFGAAPPYYEGILGGQTCHRHPRRCDLSAGIITDDAAGTVTFHLGHADPEFLYKLALLLAAPAPPGAPDHAIYRAPFLPGTGPYKISQYRPHASLTLVRNPYFRQWSYAAQPAGYPNVIRFDQVAGPARQESAVIAGRADLMTATFSNNGQSLATRYPARVHTSLKLGTNSCSSTPASRRSPASRPGRPSATPSTAAGSSSSATSPRARPR